MKFNLQTMIVAAAVIAAMTLEGLVFLMVMPGAPKPAAAETKSADDATEKGDAVASDTAEEPIGDPFNCTNNQQESNLHLRFKVVAVLESGRQVPFRDANNLHKTRVRQAIEKIVRSAQRADLDDPNLSTLKRLMKEEINKVLGKSFLTEAVIYDFSMIEQ